MQHFNNNSDIKVLYMGTPAMSARVLEALIQANYHIIGVVCQEDKEVGRHKEKEIVPTKEVAIKHNIPFYQPAKIRLDYSFATNLDFDVIVTMAYGQLIPQGLLDLAKVGCVNLHGSLLPKYRGAAPIQRAIMAGETMTGVTFMEMVAAMDAGRMYDTIEVPIASNDTYTLLSEKIASAASILVVKDLKAYCNGELKGHEQNEKLVTIAKKIKPEDEHLPLTLGVKATLDYIRGLSETPGAYLYLNGQKLKVFHASIANNEVIRALGEVIPNKKHFLIQLYDGQLELLVVQLEGKKKMDGASFLNGAHLLDHANVS